jgi:hypothetical protein
VAILKSLCEELLHTSTLKAEVLNDLQGATCFYADNVQSYMAENELNFYTELPKSPTVVPPFEKIWIEYSFTTNGIKQTVGFLLSRTKTKEMAINDMPAQFIGNGSQWIVLARGFKRFYNNSSEHPNGYPIPTRISGGDAPVDFYFCLNEMGAIIGGFAGIVVSFDSDYYKEMLQINSSSGNNNASSYELTLLSVVIFSLALMNCKNVYIDDETAPTPKKYRGQHLKHSVKYHVLKIKPMISYRKTSGLTGTGPAPSMHIRRGHFKDYRQGGGLFGKFRGVYWWENTVIARNSATKLVKAYDMEPGDYQAIQRLKSKRNRHKKKKTK